MAEKSLTIYHNPRCSKSRCALELLRERGIEPQVVHYLETPLSRSTLQLLVKQLNLASVRELMRTKEDDYKALGLATISDESALLDALVSHPKLLERPIVSDGQRAAIGRPPENVLELLA